MIATTSAERAEFLSGQGVEQASGKRQEPSEKAFEVFHLVEIVGISTREAAEQVGISHTRVVQLRDAVERWIGAQPSRREKLTKEQRLRVAEYKAELRLDHLYSLALGAWRSSQGQEFVQRGGSDGSFRTVVRHCHGKANYLNLASRIVLAQAKLAISMAKAADDRSGDRGDANDASNPPEEDCSVERDAEAASDETQPAASEASADPDATCDVSAAPVVSASCENRRETNPVQLPPAMLASLDEGRAAEAVRGATRLSEPVMKAVRKEVGRSQEQRRREFLTGK